jgi:hypothetical protein
MSPTKDTDWLKALVRIKTKTLKIEVKAQTKTQKIKMPLMLKVWKKKEMKDKLKKRKIFHLPRLMTVT